MLIPIDRPLIDARNIRAAATQTVAGDNVDKFDWEKFIANKKEQ